MLKKIENFRPILPRQRQSARDQQKRRVEHVFQLRFRRRMCWKNHLPHQWSYQKASKSCNWGYFRYRNLVSEDSKRISYFEWLYKTLLIAIQPVSHFKAIRFQLIFICDLERRFIRKSIWKKDLKIIQYKPSCSTPPCLNCNPHKAY